MKLAYCGEKNTLARVKTSFNIFKKGDILQMRTNAILKRRNCEADKTVSYQSFSLVHEEKSETQSIDL